MVVATPAAAVQTDRFGLAATGQRTALVHPAGTGAVADSVTVTNRTATVVEIDLDVVAATRQPDGTFNLGASGAGLAARIRLAARKLRLAPHGEQVVGVTIDRPAHVDADTWAAVTAVERATPGAGVSVRQRLAVFVGVTRPAGGGVASGHRASGGGSRAAAVTVAAVMLAGAVVALAVAATRRRSARVR